MQKSIRFPNAVRPVKFSYLRSALITLIAVLMTYILVAITLLLMPMSSELAAEIVPRAILISTIVPIMVTFPITIFVQRERCKLAIALNDLEEVHAELERRARLDPLTGMLNREAFLEDIEARRAAGGANGAMLMIDVDHFKSINDTFGHHAGDEALRLIATTIRSNTRRIDVSGRLGGEEFGVYLHNDSEVCHEDVAERIRKAIGAIEFTPKPGTVRIITVSVGLARARPYEQGYELLRRADQSMYEAKNAGRDQVMISTAA